MSNSIEVSVVIPVYNGARYIQNAIESVLAQTYQDFELIIIDDGSTDNTPAVLQNYESHPKIKILRQNNQGLSAARNSGIQASIGKYIALLDCDDIWRETKLEQQVNKIKSSPECAIIYTDCSYIDLQGQVLENDADYYHLDPQIKGHVYDQLIVNNQICGSGSAVLIPRDIFSEMGLFDINLKSCEDHDMWLRITSKYPVDYVEESLVQIRVHPAGMQRNLNRMFLFSIVILVKQSTGSGNIQKVRDQVEYILSSQLTYERWQMLSDYEKVFPEMKSVLNKTHGQIAMLIGRSYINRIKSKACRLMKLG